MKNENKKCSLSDHKEIDAIIFCPICKIYICKKCEKIHQGWFKNHNICHLDNNDLNEVFTGLCKEAKHSYELDYFCKTHNKLCCAKCIVKLKDKESGQHTDCDVCFIKDIENEKKNKLEENMKYLKDISNSLVDLIKELKQKFEKINENKEELKSKIQKIFTNLRNAINEREDKLLLEVDEEFNKSYFKEDFIKKSEKLPKLVEIALEKGKNIYSEWNNDKLNFYINDCLNIENNINKIKKINEVINKNSSDLNISFIIVDEEILKIVELIKNLGKIKLVKDYFDSKIQFEQNLIHKWLDNKRFITELLFRKTEDGSKPEDFHNKCDNKGNTLIIIETKKGYKFGAYTELNWDSNKHGCQKDQSTFLFSFNNRKKYNIKNNNGSIGCNGSNDLWYGSSWPEIHFDKTLDKGRSFDSQHNSTFYIKKELTNGEEYWDVKELEVFKITYI